MSLEQENLRERRQLLDKLDREIIRDLLSICALQMTIGKRKKQSRSEALRDILKEYFSDKPEVIQQIDMADERRNLKNSPVLWFSLSGPVGLLSTTVT